MTMCRKMDESNFLLSLYKDSTIHFDVITTLYGVTVYMERKMGLPLNSTPRSSCCAIGVQWSTALFVPHVCRNSHPWRAVVRWAQARHHRRRPG